MLLSYTDASVRPISKSQPAILTSNVPNLVSHYKNIFNYRKNNSNKKHQHFGNGPETETGNGHGKFSVSMFLSQLRLAANRRQPPRIAEDPCHRTAGRHPRKGGTPPRQTSSTQRPGISRQTKHR